MTLSQTQNDPYRQGLALLELGRLYLILTQADQSLNGNCKTKALTMLNEAADKFESLGAAYDFHLTQTVLSQIQTDGQVKAGN